MHGTNEWIWDHPGFISWRHQSCGSLAIVGKPGSGKSVLAKYIMTNLQNYHDDQTSNDQISTRTGYPALLSAWFYSKRSGEQFVRHEVLLQSLLHELLEKDPGLFDMYKPIYRAAPPGPQRIWRVEEMEALMKIFAASKRAFLVVIDAVDEAVDDSVLRLVETLSQAPGSNMKFVILTRPVRLLDRKYWNARKIILQNENQKDIRKLAAKRCDVLKRLLHEADADMDVDSNSTDSQLDDSAAAIASTFDPWSEGCNLEAYELQQLCDTIIDRSEGVILWVILVFDSLNEMVAREGYLSLAEIRHRATQMPRGLDGFYTQFVQELQDRHDEKGQAKVRRALMWISAANEIKSFTLGELYDALAVPDAEQMQLQDLQNLRSNPIDRNRIPANSWSGRRRVIQRLCGSFIDIIKAPDEERIVSDEEDSSAVVQLMHQTVKDFLMFSDSAAGLRFQSEEAATMMKTSAISYVNVMLPLAPCHYSPVPLKEYKAWEEGVDAAIEAFQELRFLPFCVSLATENPTIQSVLQEPAKLALSWGFLSHQNSQASKDYPSAQAIIVRFFHEAIRKGKPQAVRSMLSLSKLLNGWWRSEGHMVRNATLFTIFEYNVARNLPRNCLSGEIIVSRAIRTAVSEVVKWCVVNDTDYEIKSTDYTPESREQDFIDGTISEAAMLIGDIWSAQNTDPNALPLPMLVRQLFGRSHTSHSDLRIALYYLVLLKFRALECSEMLEELSRLGMLELVRDPRAMFLGALIVAEKLSSDHSHSAEDWEKISGLSKHTVAAAEWAFLKAVSFDLYVSEKQWLWWEGTLDAGMWTNQRLWNLIDNEIYF